MSQTPRYDSFDDPYCYAGTSTLRNKLDLQDSGALEAFEHESVSAKAEEALPNGSFDVAHYRAIHRHLFDAVYDWAGEYRTVHIAKRGAMFCYPEHIAGQMSALFACLNGAAFHAGCAEREFVPAAAKFIAELNAIHPFREGNGRTQLTFLFLLGERADVHLNFANIAPDAVMAAMVGSFNGDLTPLEVEIRQMLE